MASFHGRLRGRGASRGVSPWTLTPSAASRAVDAALEAGCYLGGNWTVSAR
jgi:hypothetical protein